MGRGSVWPAWESLKPTVLGYPQCHELQVLSWKLVDFPREVTCIGCTAQLMESGVVKRGPS